MRLLPRSTIAALFVLGASAGIAAAQDVGPTWAGYNPGYSWGMGTPGVTYSPAVAVTTIVGQPPSAAWTGYAPYTAWSGYAPGVAWQYLDPRAGTVPAYVASPATRGNVVSGPLPRGNGVQGGRPSSYREYGSGRPVQLHKPWLPGSLR